MEEGTAQLVYESFVYLPSSGTESTYVLNVRCVCVCVVCVCVCVCVCVRACVLGCSDLVGRYDLVGSKPHASVHEGGWRKDMSHAHRLGGNTVS